MSDIDAHYKNAKAVLWVEDPETRAWLEAVWLGAAPNILVLVAGGHTNVDAVCEQAKESGHKHVFGLVDCDFGTSNRHRWTTLAPHERLYRLDVHEFENLLLEPAAMVGCQLNTGKRLLPDIEARLLGAATTRVWWVACSKFLGTTRVAATHGYPPNPGLLASLADAEAYVMGSPWFASTAASCHGLATPAAVAATLTTAHTAAVAELANGAWKTTFPGKEIFRGLVGYVNPGAKGASGRTDLVKAIGAWQHANGVPTQAIDLRREILARV